MPPLLQAAFCKELRDNLGARLEKRGQELEALSSQIAALVRTATAQVTALEKVASDQVRQSKEKSHSSIPLPSFSFQLNSILFFLQQMYAGQASIEKTLAMTQAIRDSQLRAIQNYHKQTFLPLAATVATLLTDQASALTAMGVQLITKVRQAGRQVYRGVSGLQDLRVEYDVRLGWERKEKKRFRKGRARKPHQNPMSRCPPLSSVLHHTTPHHPQSSYILQVEMLQDVYLTYATRQADTLKKVAQEVEMFSAKHSNLVTRSGDHANHLHFTAENFVRVSNKYSLEVSAP